MDELGKYKVLNRSKMREVLQLNSIPDVCLDASCAVEAGKILAVQYLVYGTVGKVGDMNTANVFLVNVETSETVESRTVDQREVTKLLTPGMENLARGLAGLPVIATPYVAPRPPVVNPRTAYVPPVKPAKRKSSAGKVILISGLVVGGVAAAVAAACSD